MSSENTAFTKWITPKELNKEYGFGLSTQAKLRMDNKIPYYKIGHFIKYDRVEVDLWIKSNKVEARA